MKITSQQLAFVLGIPKKNAKIVILRSLRKDGQEYSELDHDLHPDPRADVSVIEEHEKIELQFALDDIRNNALKRAASKQRLLYDYPAEKLKAIEKKRENTPKSDKKVRTKTISLPLGLRSLLSKEVLDEIGEYWNSHFELEGVVFKP